MCDSITVLWIEAPLARRSSASWTSPIVQAIMKDERPSSVVFTSILTPFANKSKIKPARSIFTWHPWTEINLLFLNEDILNLKKVPELYQWLGKLNIKSKTVSGSKNTLSQRSSIKMHLNHVKYCDIFLFCSQVLLRVLWRKSQNLKKPKMSNQKIIIPFKIIFV